MGKRIAAVGIAAALGVGGLAVAAVNPLGIAGAQDDTTATTAPADAAGGREGPLQRALDGLVADGTLTQDQADAVLDATKGEAQEARTQRQQRRQENRAEVLQAAADAIGSTPDEVKAGVEAGTSIAAQAEAAGVDRQVLDDAITTLLAGRIDAAQADGRLTDEQAAKAKEHLDQVVDRILDADGQGGAGGTGRLRQRLRDRLGD